MNASKDCKGLPKCCGYLMLAVWVGRALSMWSMPRHVLMLGETVQVSDEQMKELAVKTETTNPWYWGVRTLVKVGPVGILLIV